MAALAPTVLATLLAGAGFTDDFESNVLWAPDGGKWDTVATLYAGVTLRPTPVAAHRGQLGLRITDDDAHPDGGDAPQAWLIHSVSGFGPDVYLRYWARQSFSGVGQVEIDYLHLNPDGGERGSSGTAFRLPNGGLQVGGSDRVSRLVITPVDGGLTPGEWHLVELSTTGLGSASGARHLWLDGRHAGGLDGLDFRTFALDAVSIGENFATPATSTGTLDFDDVSLSPTPNATWLALAAPASMTAGDCVPLDVSVEDAVTGAPAGVPYEVVVSIAGAGASVFADAACATASTGVVVAAGQSSGRGWMVVAQPGAYSLSALHPDLLSRAPAAISVGFGRLSTGCGCGAPGGAAAWLGLVALARLVSARASRAR